MNTSASDVMLYDLYTVNGIVAMLGSRSIS